MMAIELDNVISVGDRRVAAVVQRSVARSRGSRAVKIWFAKRPLAILIADGRPGADAQAAMLAAANSSTSVRPVFDI